MNLFIKLFALVLCLTMVLAMSVACVKDRNQDDEIFEDYQGESNGDAEDSEGFVTAPPAEETEDDAYINAAPANDEQGWGPLTPRP